MLMILRVNCSIGTDVGTSADVFLMTTIHYNAIYVESLSIICQFRGWGKAQDPAGRHRKGLASRLEDDKTTNTESPCYRNGIRPPLPLGTEQVQAATCKLAGEGSRHSNTSSFGSEPPGTTAASRLTTTQPPRIFGSNTGAYRYHTKACLRALHTGPTGRVRGGSTLHGQQRHRDMHQE
jgi:hypothetical protein